MDVPEKDPKKSGLRLTDTLSWNREQVVTKAMRHTGQQ